MSELDQLQRENELYRYTLEQFFKVVEVNGKQYRPSQKLCGGCPHITIARGWECYYKRHTTECEYPQKLERAASEAA